MRKFSLVTALIVALVIPTPNPANAACSSSAKITGKQVTLCIEVTKGLSTPSAATKTVTSVRTLAPVVIPKPLLPQPVAQTRCPSTVGSTKALALAILSACTAPKVVLPTQVIQKKSTVTKTLVASSFTLSDSSAFTPDKPQIILSQIDYQVGEILNATSNAAPHGRQTLLLDQPAQVNFTPMAFRWDIDSAQVAANPILSSSVMEPGQHMIGLEVDFEVAYRFGSTSTFTVLGIITMTDSAAITVTMPSATPSMPAVTPRLVAGSCSSRPSAYRC